MSALPRPTREAMLRGIERHRIVAGAYVDRSTGGICPMLAAHRNGGRTSVAGFARIWDAYTGARRPRLATRRELRTLRSLLEQSLTLDADPASGSIAELAAQLRAERALLAREAPAREDATLDLLAATEAELADQGAWRRTEAREPVAH